MGIIIFVHAAADNFARKFCKIMVEIVFGMVTLTEGETRNATYCRGLSWRKGLMGGITIETMYIAHDHIQVMVTMT